MATMRQAFVRAVQRCHISLFAINAQISARRALVVDLNDRLCSMAQYSELLALWESSQVRVTEHDKVVPWLTELKFIQLYMKHTILHLSVRHRETKLPNQRWRQEMLMGGPRKGALLLSFRSTHSQMCDELL